MYEVTYMFYIKDFLIHCKIAKPVDDTRDKANFVRNKRLEIIILMLDDDRQLIHVKMTVY